MRPVLSAVVLAVVAVLGLTACSAQSADTVRAFPTSGVPDYQLGGAYTPARGVTIVERDSTAHPAPGAYGICYVNGFQTQPGDAALWTGKHPGALLRNDDGDDDGDPVSDPGWPDEMLLDTRTAATRAEIVSVLTTSIVRCADRGFDAVEFDNLDSWTRSHGALTRAGNTVLAKALVAVAHEHGLAAGQKNTPQLAGAGKRDVGFDFAVAEECVTYDECSAYTEVYGDRVIDIEYTDDTAGSWPDVCDRDDRPAMTILRDRDLVAPDDEAYVFEHC
ncbi:endo alpha-1,4 polygalactosaminidase [Curtobacterium sp. MCBA15_001]|uniref:endo alpha-1,4 polygalactosaminidase n=1 Tax=Curtobacterium sp. MCBA15_001 TaxID=1898731 RepID=UPI0008DC940A|nr:endo alpha-1,4 polygalactosaminidase [Curtobacterium sp. MCBA15_001]OIH95416.1 hypothetical protein BIU90_01550 [Curtobacterium sp. MCBA15_001]